jgi:hypothetical protein
LPIERWRGFLFWSCAYLSQFRCQDMWTTRNCFSAIFFRFWQEEEIRVPGCCLCEEQTLVQLTCQTVSTRGPDYWNPSYPSCSIGPDLDISSRNRETEAVCLEAPSKSHLAQTPVAGQSVRKRRSGRVLLRSSWLVRTGCREGALMKKQSDVAVFDRG